MAMVRPSTQQTVDRILGTAAILSLSVVLVRRLLLSSQNKSHYHHHHSPRRGQGRGQHQFEDDNNDNKWRWWGHYWLWKGVRGGGITSLQRRRDHDTGNKDRTEEVDHDKRMHEHSGSCHCGSIQFLVQGPKRLRAMDTPGKIRFPHVSIPAIQFKLVCGEDRMRFYYEDTITDDSSSITFDILPPPRGTTSSSSSSPILVSDTTTSHPRSSHDNANSTTHASCAFCFCGNCGVHVFHADRSLGVLEINANCLDGEEGEAKVVFYGEEEEKDEEENNDPQLALLSSLSSKHALHHGIPPPSSSSSKTCTIIETVSENEPYLGGSSRLIQYVGDNNNNVYNNCYVESVQLRTKESSMSSSDPTAMMAESDDLSMTSSSIAGGVSLTQYHSLLSVASSVGAAAPASSSSSTNIYERSDRTGLSPRPPSSSRMSPSNRSVTTLPSRLDGRHGRYNGSRGGMGGGSSWSVASIELQEFDGMAMDTSSTVSPRIRDQMKKYLSSHMAKK